MALTTLERDAVQLAYNHTCSAEAALTDIVGFANLAAARTELSAVRERLAELLAERAEGT